MKYLKIAVLLMFFILPAVMPSVALAVDPPASTPSVTNVHGFGYLIEEGDVLIYGDYDIPYTTLPDVPANLTYTFRLLDSDGNEMGAVVPYVYFDYGYNTGAFGLYFDGAVTFGGDYTIRISQNPAYFATPQNYDYAISSSAWSTAATHEESQTELAVAVISTAERLGTEYSTGNVTINLLESGLTDTVLSSPLGETYFRGAVYGIQVMAPDLFMYQIIPYDSSEDRVWGDNQSENYTGRYEGTDIGTGVEATGVQFGMTGTAVMALAFAFPVCLGFIIVSAKKFHKTEPGFLISALVVLMVYMMGWMPAAIFATIYQLCGIYVAYVWFYARG